MKKILQLTHENPNNFLQKVKTRDGKIIDFNLGKITKALTSAGYATGEFKEKKALELACTVLNALKEKNTSILEVEIIQDTVEDVLLSSNYKQTAKAYILYREQHAFIRAFSDSTQVDLVDNYLNKNDWKVKENSNMSYSLQGLNNYIASEITTTYWLGKIYPPQIKEAHKKGDFHIHDLNLLSAYCVGWDLYDLLVSGFKGVKGKAQSAPPSHFRSALGQIVNFFYTLQGEAAGAQAFSNFDTLLAPFIKYDNLQFNEVKSAIKAFVFNLNVPTRVGFQTPFTNLTLDLNPSALYKDMNVIIGGKPQKETYAQFQKEINDINRALFEVLSEGDALGRVFTFPIPTINIGPDFNYDDPNLLPMWQGAAKYGIPYFANFVNSDMSIEDTRSMCCRLRLDTKQLRKRGGGLFGANPLTGSIGVVTINLPKIGRFASTREEFLSILKKNMYLAKTSLDIKRKVLEKFTQNGLYPYSSYYLRHIKQRYNFYWQHHFSTIGIVGMHEALINLMGKGIEDSASREFALEVMDFMLDLLTKFQEDQGHSFNLEATPAESACFNLARLDAIDQGLDPEEVTPYTNSTALPVNYSTDILEVLDHQDKLQSKYTGGTVLHIFTGEANTDPGSIKQFVKTICQSCKMPYFTITPTFSICLNHGYLSGEHSTCPICQEDCEIYSRVVGYLRPVDQWNKGKAEEFKNRTLFKLEQAL